MNRGEEKAIGVDEVSQPSHDQPKSIDNNSSSPSPSSSSSAPSKNSWEAKTCKGCLYYSSNFKANLRNPLCVGIHRSVPELSPYLSGLTTGSPEENQRVKHFRYACVGRSLYVDRKGQSSQTELPACIGLKVLVDMSRKANAADSTSDQVTPIRNREDGNGLPQQRSPKPANTTGTEPAGNGFFTRFKRNANVVANGVVKNMRKAGNQIKQSIEDIVNPYRGRPK